ncbi:MAG: hypothetical protein LH679_05175 [Cyanobacteria bacterium CAN_BIN43]|jgi:hypothetical protein|nr:hypothetical protein [Cyanobacteria bacterium CAN_BIN43]
MNAYKVETVVAENGRLVLQGLPFQAGDRVEVIILERSGDQLLQGKNNIQLESSDQDYLDGLVPLMSEWKSEADEVAYSDL